MLALPVDMSNAVLDQCRIGDVVSLSRTCRSMFTMAVSYLTKYGIKFEEATKSKDDSPNVVLINNEYRFSADYENMYFWDEIDIHSAIKFSVLRDFASLNVNECRSVKDLSRAIKPIIANSKSSFGAFASNAVIEETIIDVFTFDNRFQRFQFGKAHKYIANLIKSRKSV